MEVAGNKFELKTLKRLLVFLKPYRLYFLLLTLVIVLSAVSAPLIPFLISKTINNDLLEGSFEGLQEKVVWMLVILLVQSVLSFLNTYMSAWLGQTVIRDIRTQLYQHVLRLRLKFFDNTPIGQLITRNISDVEALAEVFSQGLAAMIAELLQIAFILGFMFWLNWRLTLISLATFPLLLLSTYVFKEKIKSSYDAVRTAVANLNTFVQEHVTGMSIVQVFNTEEREFKRFQEINKEHRKAHLKSVKYYSIYFPVAEVIGAIGIGLLLWYGAHGLVSGWVPQIGTLIAFIMYLQMFFRPIRLIADRFNTLQMGLISISRIAKLFDNTDKIQDDGKVEKQAFDGDLTFKEVDFAYNPGEPVLRKVSFSVKAGEVIALVGATGAGKSSVVNLINRLYDVDSGEIAIDGQNVKDYSLQCLRNNIGVVLQDVFLFSDTVRNNISLSNINISDEDILKAAEHVGARSFIEKLPGGLDYKIQERGMNLSVGQRQLLSFIRAIVYDPKIIILDEATSSVDTETEQLIQNAINQLMKGRTAVVVAHRLSTIQHADTILVLEKGEVVEQGSHSELLEIDGAYNQLYQMQYKKEA